MQTQWRIGMDGRTGLDYTAVLAYLRFTVGKTKHRQEFFECIRACEAAVLDVWAEQRAKAAAANQ